MFTRLLKEYFFLDIPQGPTKLKMKKRQMNNLSSPFLIENKINFLLKKPTSSTGNQKSLFRTLKKLLLHLKFYVNFSFMK